MMKLILIAGTLALAACGSQPADLDVYTLYRTPLAGDEMIHMATFDTSEGEAYNRENCEIVANLLGSQPGVTVAYVCRAGRHTG